MEVIIEKFNLCDIKSLIESCQCQILTLDTIQRILSGDFTFKFIVNVEYSLIYTKIYLGKFSDVPECYVRMFAVLSFLKAFIKSFKSDNFENQQESLYLIDLGIVMASGFQETEPLTLYADFLHEQIVKNHPEIFNSSINFVKSSGDDICEIDHYEELSLESFWTNYLYQHKPVLIRNSILNWPAYTKWQDPNYFQKVAGFRTVPIEIGKKYDSDDWSQGMFKFGDFIEQYLISPDTEKPTAYLAQHDLFDQIPRLKEDIVIPEYCMIAESEPVIKAWIGPKNTISTMHTDIKHNLLCQVFGEKQIILAAPADSPSLYAYEGILNNTSKVDPTHLDIEEFPLAKTVKFYNIILKAGDLLFMPRMWWHYVQSLSASASVSFWFEVNDDDL